MNKTEFVKVVATTTGYTQKDVKEVLETAQKVAYEAMAKQEEVKIFDGLTLVGIKKDACVKRNPATGDTVDIPEKVVPKAKWGTVAKRVVNGEE